VNNLFDVTNEIVVITGGSGQLGIEYSKTFLEANSFVVSIDLKTNKYVEELKVKYKNKFLFVKCNITSKKSVIETSTQIQKTFGDVSVLINNAALDSPPDAPREETGPFESYPESSWDNVIDVNLKGVFNCCQVFGDIMAKNNKGSIINVSSIYGVVSPDQSIYEYRRKNGNSFYKPIAYSVSKSGLINMTKYLAVYWAKFKVRVNCIVLAGVDNNQDLEFKEAYCKRIPIGRMANENEYNGAMIFLASQASSYMTGSTITLDGGWTSI